MHDFCVRTQQTHCKHTHTHCKHTQQTPPPPPTHPPPQSVQDHYTQLIVPAIQEDAKEGAIAGAGLAAFTKAVEDRVIVALQRVLVTLFETVRVGGVLGVGVGVGGVYVGEGVP